MKRSSRLHPRPEAGAKYYHCRGQWSGGKKKARFNWWGKPHPTKLNREKSFIKRKNRFAQPLRRLAVKKVKEKKCLRRLLEKYQISSTTL